MCTDKSDIQRMETYCNECNKACDEREQAKSKIRHVKDGLNEVGPNVDVLHGKRYAALDQVQGLNHKFRHGQPPRQRSNLQRSQCEQHAPKEKQASNKT